VEGRIKRNIYSLIGVTFVLFDRYDCRLVFALIKPLKERTATTSSSMKRAGGG
jgi:hypothetical protein